MTSKRKTFAMVGLLLTLIEGCMSPISPDSISVKAVSVDDSTLLIKIDDFRLASYMYTARADVTRKSDVIRVTFFQQTLHSDADQNIDIPGVALKIGPNDREVRLTDGKTERVVWRRPQ